MNADTPIEAFHEKIARHIDIKLDLVINENRCTMLNVLERKRDRARLSIHRMFLDAPEDVISAIAHYVQGMKKKGKEGRDLLLRGYIQSNLSRFNYSNRLNQSTLNTQGKVYDLDAIYKQLNSSYFQDRLKLRITWYGKPFNKRRSRVIFGQYYDHLKLIKIHRMMDDPFFPEYFVRFVVYHEMLHEVIPGYVDERGFFRTHGAKFKEEERKFLDYEKAITWERKNKKFLFK